MLPLRRVGGQRPRPMWQDSGAMVQKRAVVVHSGGMDSSLCLRLAVEEFGSRDVLAVGFQYGQRHSSELKRASEVCSAWNVERIQLGVDCLSEITENALVNGRLDIVAEAGAPPNTLVVGRNGLMARLAAIHAHHLGARCIYMGVIEVESANSGYRDCSRAYMDLMQQILRIDLADDGFEIRTPLVRMTKKETMELGHRLGVLEFLLDRTVTCYEGLPHAGCRRCPACKLRNDGLREFLAEHPSFKAPFEP